MLPAAPRRYIVGGVTATGRRLLGLYVRPLLFAALEARAREHGWDFDIEVREILERAVRSATDAIAFTKTPRARSRGGYGAW